MSRSTVAGVVLALATACIAEAPGRESEEQPGVPLTVRSGANFGRKVELVTVTFQPGRVAPGGRSRVVAVFRVFEELDKDYTVFVHVEDVQNRAQTNVDHRPNGGRDPTTKWKRGDIVRDEFTVVAPTTLRTRGLNIWMGFWDPGTDRRLPLVNADAVRNDRHDRVLVAFLPVGTG